MPHKHYRAVGNENYLDGTEQQSSDDLYDAFYNQYNSYPDAIYSIDEHGKIIDVTWSGNVEALS